MTYELIHTDGLPIDTNPNAGSGLRIFPDRKVPSETLDRRRIRVKAQYSQPTPGVRIFFRNFDVDDPSADTAPIDSNDTTAVRIGNDNNGNVDGNPATRAGVLHVPLSGQPNPYNCSTFTNSNASGVSCQTDSNGVAIVEYSLTLQPGDNFSVIASPEESYISSLVPAVDGINFKDQNDIEIPVTRPNSNECESPAIGNKACRSEMLTVWRQLHIEVDRMGNVGSINRVAGTVTSTGLLPGNCSNVGATPMPTPSPSPTPLPCSPDATVLFISPNAGQEVEDGRFTNGRMVVDKRSYFVRDNTPTAVVLRNVDGVAAKTSTGKSFVLYDDDDFNADDVIVDGDTNENLVRLPESFRYVTAEDGFYENGRRKNIFSEAYVRPEYVWAEQSNYNQVNLDFELNLQSVDVTNALNGNRNSGMAENDRFWIGYLLIAYQGDRSTDGDGESLNLAGEGPTVPIANLCDCEGQTSCAGVACSVFPIGVEGSVVYQESMQDARRSFLRIGVTIDNLGTTVPHEIGHQLGLMGDNRDPQTFQNTRSSIFNLMDYPRLPNQSYEYFLHPQHINIIRKRITSPGR